MDTVPSLFELYKQRLNGLQQLLTRLPDFVAEDQAAKCLSNPSGMIRYQTERVMEICSNALRDEKELTIITILEALHKTTAQKQQLEEVLRRNQTKDRISVAQHLEARCSSLAAETSQLKTKIDKLSRDNTEKQLQIERLQRELESKTKQLPETTKMHPSIVKNMCQRCISRSRSPSSQLQWITDQVGRLETQLQNLKLGFQASKLKCRKTMNAFMDEIKKSLVSLKKSIVKMISLAQEQSCNALIRLQTKFMDYIKYHENNDNDMEIIRLRKEAKEKQHKIRILQADSFKSQQLIETTQQLESSYRQLMKKYDDLSMKHQRMLTFQEPTTDLRNDSIPLVDHSNMSTHQGPIFKQVKEQLSPKYKPQSHSSLMDRSFKEPGNKNVDPFLKRLDDEIEPSHRRVQLELGFNQLESEIQAIIQRRNKRNPRQLI